MNISFICTVYNEENTIIKLLESINQQTRPPDEIVIVDAGSTDSTVDKIRQFSTKIPVKIIIKPCPRGQGRNLAIKQAGGEVIAVSDAGCIARRDWLAKITQPITARKIDVVAGFYQMTTKGTQYYTAPFVGVTPQRINPKTFLPSSRSIAFTKSAWKKVGGYPRHLNYAEDIVFAQSLADHPDIKMTVQPQALVEWPPPATYREFFRALVNYTQGNIIAGYTRHLKKNALVVIRYAIGIQLLLAATISLNPVLLALGIMLLAVYSLYPAWKFHYLIRSPLDIIMFGWTQLVADLAILYALFTPI